jgi:hypothetical protein
MLKTYLRRLQRNHALEHATINLVNQRYPGVQIIGLSDPAGFNLYTSLAVDKVAPLVGEALDRLKSGQIQLALHDNCGTNVVVTAMLTTLATLLGMGRRTKRPLRRLIERLPYAILLNALALFAAPSAAYWVQSKVTTDPHLENVEIGTLHTNHKGGMQRVRVHTIQR